MKVEPRVIRHKDAPTYLGVNINYFDKNIRPDITEIKFGPQMIGYDHCSNKRYKAADSRISHDDLNICNMISMILFYTVNIRLSGVKIHD